MPVNNAKKLKSNPGTLVKSLDTETDDTLRQLAFDNTAQPNLITIVSSGKIILANSAAAKLLGYSKRELLAKSRSSIFDINDTGFKKMLKQRSVDGSSAASVTAIKKSGKTFACTITSAVFTGEHGIKKAITTITDMSQHILEQKNIDAQNKKTVAGNIVIAREKQKAVDIKNKKRVVADIVKAKAKQKAIDSKKEKTVADNILLAQTKSDVRFAENNEWIKYIAKASYDVMWDWDIATGEIYVGESVKEVFGYTVLKNTIHFTDFSHCLLPEEKEKVEKKIKKTLASGSKVWDDACQLKRFDGSVASTTSRASIIRDDTGKATRLIGAIQDVSRVQELEKKLEAQIIIQQEGNEHFMLAAKLSFDVIWDWDLLTNEVMRGEGYEELFGYPFKKNKGNITDWLDHIHPEDKDVVEKGLRNAFASPASHWEQIYRFTRADGSVAKIFDRGSIFRHADGKAYRMIGAMHDLSGQSEQEEKPEPENAARANEITAYAESFKLIFNSSTDVLFDADLASDKVLVSDAYEKVFGYKITGNIMTTAEWARHIHPDDKEAALQDYDMMLASDAARWEHSYRFVKADNSVANIVSSRVILRYADGKAYRMIGSMHDISKQKSLEEKLEQEIKLKEKQITEAVADAKETERSDIGKELHDNINQLLGASRMYLEMAKRGGENSAMYLSRSSEYTLTAIEEIRKLTKGLTTDIIKNLGLCEAIEKAVRDIMEVNKVKISCALDSFKEDSTNEKFKLNVFRIIQEQMNNILKHAHATEVTINLSQNKKSIVLSIADNGVGIDTLKKGKGIGLENIKSRAASYNGTTDIVSQPGQGFALTVKFPFTEKMLA